MTFLKQTRLSLTLLSLIILKLSFPGAKLLEPDLLKPAPLELDALLHKSDTARFLWLLAKVLRN